MKSSNITTNFSHNYKTDHKMTIIIRWKKFKIKQENIQYNDKDWNMEVI